MRIRRVVSAIVVVTLFSAVTPRPLLAGDTAAPGAEAAPAGAPTGLRTSIDRAGAAAAAELPFGQTGSQRTVAMQMTGGGGSKTMLVVGLVTAAAGAAATYFVIKEMRKETDRNVRP